MDSLDQDQIILRFSSAVMDGQQSTFCMIFGTEEFEKSTIPRPPTHTKNFELLSMTRLN